MPVRKKKPTAKRPKAAKAKKRAIAPMKRAKPWPEWLAFVEWQASEMLAIVDLVNRLRLAEVKAGVSVDVPGFTGAQPVPLFDDEGLEHKGVRFASASTMTVIGNTYADVRRALMKPNEIAQTLSPAQIRAQREEWENRLREWASGIYAHFADTIRARSIKRVSERRQKFYARGNASKAKMWQELADEFEIDGGERSIKRAMGSHKAQGGILDVDPRILHYDPLVPAPHDMTSDSFDPDQDKKRKKVS